MTSVPPDVLKKQREFIEQALPCARMLAGLARSLTRSGDDANDLVQQTLLRGYLGWEGYALEKGASVSTWLCTIMRHLRIDEYRRKSNTEPYGDLEELEVTGALTDMLTALAEERKDPESEPLGPEVAAALESLPTHYREVLVLADLKEWDYQEVADYLCVPIGTVKAWIFRARQLLQYRLAAYAERRGYPSAVTMPLSRSSARKRRI